MPGIASEKPSFSKYPPLCCDSVEQADLWVFAADHRDLKSPDCGFCTDCHREFKLKMLAEKRCENPGVEFRRNRKEGTYGVLL